MRRSEMLRRPGQVAPRGRAAGQRGILNQQPGLLQPLQGPVPPSPRQPALPQHRPLAEAGFVFSTLLTKSDLKVEEGH